MIVAFTVLVAFIAMSLIWHYTQRMTGARQEAERVRGYLEKAGVPCDRITGADPVPNTWRRDQAEIFLFFAILLLSCVPAAIACTQLPLKPPVP
jgi:hypothetical protein